MQNIAHYDHMTLTLAQFFIKNALKAIAGTLQT